MSSNERYNYFCMFTPEGKVLPIESVIRTTEHGGVCVAVRSETVGVIISQRTGKDEKLAIGKSKIMQLDENLVYTYSGITNDGVRYGERIKRNLQKEKQRTGITLPIACLIEKEQFNSGIEVMRYGNRATGVSVIIMGVEKNKVKLLEINPTGEAFPCFGSCIGSRAQSARTVLDAKAKEIQNMDEQSLQELAFNAFRNAVNDPDAISAKTYDICVVSVEQGVKLVKSE